MQAALFHWSSAGCGYVPRSIAKQQQKVGNNKTAVEFKPVWKQYRFQNILNNVYAMFMFIFGGKACSTFTRYTQYVFFFYKKTPQGIFNLLTKTLIWNLLWISSPFHPFFCYKKNEMKSTFTCIWIFCFLVLGYSFLSGCKRKNLSALGEMQNFDTLQSVGALYTKPLASSYMMHLNFCQFPKLTS